MRTGTVSYKLEDLKKGVIIPIGFVGENDFTKVFFDAEEIYKKYPSASVSMKVQPPKGGIYPATVTRDGNTVIWQVKEADVANRGGGELQLTFTDGETKIKTYIAKTDVKRSLTGNGPAPDPIQGWIDDADEKLAEVEQALDDLAAMDNIAKTAQASDIGKALSPKTVENGVVTEWEYITPGGGTEDYTDLDNKPSIAGVTLSGNKTLEDLGIAADDDLDNLEGEVSDVKTAIQGKYTKPSGGIPATDLEQAVQTSLGNADTAYQKPNSGIPASDMASGVIPVLTDLLDDTAGENDTDKTWSADKLFKLESFVEETSLSPAQIQTIVADGRASEFFSICDIIIIPWTDYSQTTAVTYDFPFVVANIADCVDDNGVTHHNALWLQAMVATPQTIQFDAPEQIVATEETFQHGMYYYTKNADDSFTEQSVTAGDPIPTGTTYYKHYRTGMSGRLRYGSNSYKESAIRQWLNSSGAKNAWWTAQHESDVAPTQHSSVPGYLTGFNDDWLSVIKPVEVKCYRNTVCDGGGWDTMYDRFFLPSLEEVYGSSQLSGEGVYFPYWKEETGLQSPSNGSSTDTNDARKIPSVANKYGSAVHVRLRSAYRDTTTIAWGVYSTGCLGYGNAHYSYRFLPACVIY